MSSKNLSLKSFYFNLRAKFLIIDWDGLKKDIENDRDINNNDKINNFIKKVNEFLIDSEDGEWKF